MPEVVGYARVSTDKQGQSGLGLEAQEECFRRYAEDVGGRVIKVYVEVETGKGMDPDRPQLRSALAHAKRARATLVVGRLDRLSRNVAFVSALMESNVDFVCCDNPHANRLTLHILAAVAEDEARRISERTKAALAAYKARGGKLGGARPECRNLTQTDRLKGARAAGMAHRASADAAYVDIAPTMRKRRKAGWTLQRIADELNEQGHRTRRGKPWNHVQVRAVLNR